MIQDLTATEIEQAWIEFYKTHRFSSVDDFLEDVLNEMLHHAQNAL